MLARRVAVTGLGLVTPLGVGVTHNWNRLIEGNCGIVSLLDKRSGFEGLPSTVAGLVPRGTAQSEYDPSRYFTPRVTRFC